MRARLEVIVAVAMAVAAVIFSITLLSPRQHRMVAHATLKTSLASYLGVYTTGSPPGYQPVASFARAAGRQPNLIGYFSGWAQKFNASFAEKIYRHGVVPFIQIDPTDASIEGIADGTYDDYLSAYAESVTDFGHAVVIGFGHEMNAAWYPWGYRHVPAKVFVQAWRRIIDVFRSQGADNVTWLWTIQADGPRTGPIQDWWPGPKYVTWVGVDGYYYRPADTFASVFGTTIDQVRSFTSDPVLLSETAVGPQAGQFNKIQNLFNGMAAYKTLGLVWFDKPQDDGIYHQDWRIQDSPGAEYSFKLGVRDELKPVAPAR